MNNITASVDAYPTFRLVNASVVILYAIRDVSSPGPPEVIAYTKSKAVSLQSVNGIHKVITFFRINGNVIRKKSALRLPHPPLQLRRYHRK